MARKAAVPADQLPHQPDCLSSKPDLRFKFSLTLMVTALLGISLSLAVFSVVLRNQKESMAIHFQMDAQQRVSGFQDEVYRGLAFVEALRAFYDGSQRVERDEFSAFTESVLKNAKGIRALAWLPHVPGEKRAGYEARAKRFGYEDFEFTEKGPDGSLVRAGDRKEYFPVYFVQPYFPNQRMLGFDYGAGEGRQKALNFTRDTGQLGIVYPTRLRDGGYLEEGDFLVLNPVYKISAGHEDSVWRHRHLSGFVAGVFDLRPIAAYAFNHPRKKGRIDFQIGQKLNTGNTRGIYPPEDFAGSPYPEPGLYNESGLPSYREVFKVADQEWIIVGYPSADYFPRWIQAVPFYVLAAGLFLTLIGVLYLAHMIRSGERLKRLNLSLETEIQERRRAENLLRESEEKFRNLAEQSPHMVLILRGRNVIYANPSCERILGVSAHTAADFDFSRLVVSGPAGPSASEFSKGLEGGLVFEPQEFVLRALDGGELSVMISSKLIDFAGTKAVQVIITDITRLKCAEQALRRERDAAKNYLEIVGVIIVLIKTDETVELVNKAGCGILGWEEREIQGLNWFESFVPGPVREEEKNCFRRMLDTKGGGYNYAERTVLTRTGAERSIAWNSIVLRDASGQPRGILRAGEDITERVELERSLKEANLRLQDLITIDPLTGVGNRRGLEDVLLRSMPRLHNFLRSSYAFMLDLDDFKQINDAFGYSVGDTALKETAEKMKAVLRSTDYVARIGGDEFIVLLPGAREAEARAIAEKVRLEISKVMIGVSGGQKVDISCSIGLFEISEARLSIDEIFEKARFVLRQSKERGKNILSYQQSAGPIAQHGDSLLSALEILHSGDSYRVARQPIVRIEDARIIGYELLSRIDHPEFSQPNDFFRIAQDAKILTLVDRFCMKRCLGLLKSSEPGMQYHINVFPSTLMGIPIDQLLEELKLPQDLSAARLCLEISEQQIIGDPSSLIGLTASLRKAGILVAIDDVGFGSSCLESIVLLEPDIIKIDKKYVHHLASEPGKRRSLKRILKIAESCDAVPVAEGVETDEDWAVLKDLGVAFGQGYLFGHPVLPRTETAPNYF